jgi:nitrite reductase/ring-hydroxylating ferredoxin subunit
MSDERQFYRVANVAEVPPQTGKTVAAGAQSIALFNLHGNFYALNDLCPHRGASLGEGFLDGECVLCPWHLFDFHLCTGKSETVPELKAATYEVKVEGDEVFVLV